ncbi:alpha/beta hydrolase family protein [Actinomadura rupiterrae]|uniref:alpha/beta hydrolase family protein n=1 Tax=Actinomadura rupiterrae TaxID=559627 RepID=UPI0020A48856|nr:alpha/beta hydrolase [Actinomadura rupiterrae]MCP2343190.1 pimeloyl-ACP methyl ester carboxylesterase [Actinomadura rupiterrae]
MPDVSEMIADLAKGFATPSRAPILHTPDEYGLAYEDITFPSQDGVPLEAWWIPRRGSDKLVIANHPMQLNRYGVPSNLPQFAIPGGNDFEVNYVPDYKNLHEAGYNVLTYDSRNFGHSGAANGGLFTWGLYESRDVVGSMNYVKSRPDTRGMTIGLLSRCMGGNATFRAVSRYPELFADVRCIVSPQPIAPRAMAERNLEMMGAPDKFGDLDRQFKIVTSFTIDQLSPLESAGNCHIPTFITQVRDDVLTTPSDVQSIYDALPVEDKKLFWIEGSTARWDGYTYFVKHPEQMIDWFDEHTK